MAADHLSLEQPGVSIATYEPIQPAPRYARDATDVADAPTDHDAEHEGKYSHINAHPHLARYLPAPLTRSSSRRSTRSAAESVQQQHGVDIQSAQNQFATLSRELSYSSRRSHPRPQHKVEDIEKDAVSKGFSTVKSPDSPYETKETAFETSSSSDSSTAEPFDLEELLRGRKADDEAAGIKSKHVGVYWDGLTVKGLGGDKIYVQTFPVALLNFINIFGYIMPLYRLITGFIHKTRINAAAKAEGQLKDGHVNILKDFKGIARPGEMVLVLGKPGAGCTTFLKVIANNRFGYTGIDGSVNYGAFDHKTFGKRYRGEAVYNGEDDVHLPTLTVKQTLEFALETRIPGKRPAGLSRKEFKAKVVDMLLKMFGITHTAHTFVGSAYVRGVSGGERKRVSIAEMMITNAAVCSWDNSTRGLDASTAVDYVRSLRILTNIHKVTTFVSLYQASESIYQHFDKVLVISEGRQAYFGPADQARAYFEQLGYLEKPRQTTPDYLTGCTDKFERDFQPGRSDADVPSTPDELAAAFRKSSIAAETDSEMSTYLEEIERERQVHHDFVDAVKDSKRHTSSKNVYYIPMYLQIWALFKRQFLLKWQDKFSLALAYSTSITLAIILGTVWVNLPKTSAGAFTRGGLLFISLLFNCFTAFAELANTMLGRPLVNKHRSFAFYRPSALWFAQIFVDGLFQTCQILVFSLIVYFATDLYRDPGAFFTFVLMIVTGYLSMTLFFRSVGCLCPNFDVAIRIAVIIISFFVLTTGYLIQWDSEKVWIRWIYYINTLGLGYAALIINEFKHLDLTCEGQQLIPYGPTYNDIAHQVCTLPGSTPGNPIVPGMSYVNAAFQYDISDEWRNFGIIIALIIAFMVANVTLGERVMWGAGGKTITLYKKEDSDSKKLNEALMAKRKAKTRDDELAGGTDLQIASKSVLTWEGVNYDVPVPGGSRRILNDVFGYVKPGELTALMGASGAGKTTLLDVLAARKNIGVIQGDILIDSIKPGRAFQRGTAYAEQLDVHEPATTVREALRFSADLRQPYDTPKAEKYAYVEEVISLLEMEDIADAIIGSPESGLAVEQRKRVTIGVELAAKPELLLFLDEPTSGLDSQSAWNVCRFLRKLSAAGQAILCTIHQPNAALFENFDRLLLLQKGGHCVYFGEIGKDACTMLDYFRRNGAHCPPNANPAEWMLDAIGAGQTPRIGNKDWGDIWRESPEFVATRQNIVHLKAERAKLGAEMAKTVVQKEYATPIWHQIKVVTTRQVISFYRQAAYGLTRIWNHLVIAVITGLVYLNLDNSRTSLQQSVFIVFQVTVLPALILAQVEPKYAIARMISYREQAAKAYKTFPFALSMVIAEIPYSLLCTVAFYFPLYYMPGLNPAASRAGYQFFMILLTEFFAVALGQMIAAITPTPFIAALTNPFCIITFALFCGVTIPGPQMPTFWRVWLYDALDPFHFLIEGMVVTELHEKTVVCTDAELNRFTAPPGQTCGQYLTAFFNDGGAGYLVDNSTSDCAYCAYKSGDQFYEPLGYSFDNRWRDLGVLAAYVGSSLLILFFAARFINYNKR